MSSTTFAFGVNHNWADSAAITVGVPQPFTPSNTALIGAEANGYVAGTPVVEFKITYTNTSKHAGNAYIEMSIPGSTFITDITNSVGFPPVQDIKPGHSISWMEAYSVQDPTVIKATVGPGYGATPVTFHN